MKEEERVVKTTEEIKSDYKNIDDTLLNALDALGDYEKDIQGYIAESVARICNVDKNAMFSDFDKVHTAHARWLFWYAVKYMTNVSCRRVAEQTSIYGKRYTEQGIARAVGKMGSMIENEPMWKRRWSVIKRIIKLQYDNEEQDETIIIQIPKSIKNKIKIEIKEK